MTGGPEYDPTGPRYVVRPDEESRNPERWRVYDRVRHSWPAVMYGRYVDAGTYDDVSKLAAWLNDPNQHD